MSLGTFVKILHLSLLTTTSLHVWPHFPASSKRVLFELCFGLPLLLVPCGLQPNACFSMDSYPFLRVWPIHCHFLILISNITGFSPVASHSCVLFIILGYLMPIILHKCLLADVCNLFVIGVVTFHVSHPYSSTDLTLLLHNSIWQQWHTDGGGGGSTPSPPHRNSEGLPKLCQTQPDCENC